MKIGNIVSFKSHPYNQDNHSIIISGEHLMITPLMVVIEVLAIIKDEHSETDGIPIAKKGNSNCRCIWYSSKSNQFEEGWFYSLQLQIIDESSTFDNIQQHSKIQLHNTLIGKLVALKTLNLELKKRKSSLTHESTNESNRKDKTSISSLLAFVSPVMQIIEIKENDHAEIKHDTRTGLQKRFISRYSVKCKWYNPGGDKFSEKILPLEAILLLPIISNVKLTSIKEHIEKTSILKIQNSLFKPLSISYRSGYYILNGFDFVKNINLDYPLTEETIIKTEDPLYLNEAPAFKMISAAADTMEWKTINTIENLILDCIKSKNYLRIKYKGLSDILSTRTLKNLVLHKTMEQADGIGKVEEVHYLEAYCYLRKAERYFRIDRILTAQQMNLIYIDPNVLPESIKVLDTNIPPGLSDNELDIHTTKVPS